MGPTPRMRSRSQELLLGDAGSIGEAFAGLGGQQCVEQGLGILELLCGQPGLVVGLYEGDDLEGIVTGEGRCCEQKAEYGRKEGAEAHHGYSS